VVLIKVLVDLVSYILCPEYSYNRLLRVVKLIKRKLPSKFTGCPEAVSMTPWCVDLFTAGSRAGRQSCTQAWPFIWLWITYPGAATGYRGRWTYPYHLDDHLFCWLLFLICGKFGLCVEAPEISCFYRRGYFHCLGLGRFKDSLQSPSVVEGKF
jgi:hypothetical protein